MTLHVNKGAAVRPQPASRARNRFTASVTLATATVIGATALAIAPAANSSEITPATTATAPTTAAPAAATAPAVKKHKLRLTVTKSATTAVKGYDRITLRVKTKEAGKKAKLTVTWKGKKIATRTMKTNRVKLRLPAKIHSGNGRLKVTVAPSKAAAATGVKANTKRVRIRVLTTRDAVVAAAKKQIGVPYRAGGSTPRGFDCSGFTQYVYDDALDKNLPRSSSSYRNVGKRISRANAKPGDIIWTPGHVAIYLGNNKIIDSPRPGKTIQVRAMYQSNPTFLRVL